MFLTIIIAFFSLIALIVIHELGHFLLAKKFGIKVEEFGIGYPPRIFGRKIGETIYSLNLLPFGAFVKIYGHENREKGADSFSEKPIWQRALVILGGVISFWVVAAVILTIVMALGVPAIVGDEENNLVDAKVQVISLSKDSPAEKAGIKIGDAIKKLKTSVPAGGQENSNLKTINKVKEVQDFTEANKGKEVVLTIQRGKEILDISLIPRESYPQGEGSMGVGIVRTALKSYPFYMAPLKGITATYNLTLTMLDGWGMVLTSLFQGKGMPQGTEVRGMVGIFDLFVQAGGLGISYFLQLIAIISVSLALVNVLPLPALDGGWFALLMIEKFRGKPINQKIEQTVSSVFFILLILLMVWVTIKDVIRLL